MRRLITGRGLAAVLSIGILAAAALAIRQAAAGQDASGRAAARSSLRQPTATAGRSSRVIQRSSQHGLSAAQLAGQRIVYAYAGLTPPASLLDAVRAGEAAGVILFDPNISSRQQIRGVVRKLQRASRASPVRAPLLIFVDQEGGEVRRLPGAPALSERQIGESAGGAQLARAAGAGAGRNLAGAGINVNLAPVLDVFRQPGDFIDQFGRSYSGKPVKVAALGRSFIAAQQRLEVAATGKHFPGLGAATLDQNTDAGPVTLGLSRHQLRSVDELPYRRAIAAGLKLVMTSWAIYPALDPRLPAGLSPLVIKRELRGRLHFHGVTITDAITAGALRPFGSLGRRGVLAAEAGADLIICSAIHPSDNSPSDGIRVRNAIAAALDHGQLSTAASQQAFERVLALRMHP